jgi:uncharacterized protein YecE (DUF72 family)
VKPVHVGCSGWVYKDWRGELYPEDLPQRRWLERYAEVFETVEINNTFYRLPSVDAVRRWAEETPDDFVFAVKGSRYTTHIKRLISFPKYSERFFERLEPLVDAGKLGPVLWQLAGNFKRDDDRLTGALEALRERPGRHAFEFRHESWFTDDVYELLRAHDAALVIGDDPERPFQAREMTGSWTYVRLHRGSAGRRGKYSSRELDVWRRRIAAWRSRHEVFVYFNNDWEGYAPKNARELSRSFSRPAV